MLIQESRKHISKEDNDKINQLSDEIDKSSEVIKIVDNQTESEWDRVADLFWEMTSIRQKSETRFLNSKTNSELIEYGNQIIKAVTFDDLIDYLFQKYKTPDRVPIEDNIQDILFVVCDFTDIEIVIRHLSLKDDISLENDIRKLQKDTDSLISSLDNQFYTERENLSELFKQAAKRAEKERKGRTHTSETDTEYIEREPSNYMNLPTSMYAQTAMSVLSRSNMRPRENPKQQMWDFSDSGYTILTIQEKRLGLHGLAIGYQKQSKNPKTIHPVFVLQNAEAITSKHNYNVRKILSFTLDKLFEHNHLRKTGTMPEYLDITTKELLDNNVFNSRKEANDGMNESIMPLSSLSLAEMNDKREILRVCTLFPSIEKLNRETKTSVSTYRIHFQTKTEIDYLGLFSYFTPCPSYFYRLSNRAGTLLYLIFARANSNKDRFKDGERGSINIKLTDIQNELDLPSLESVRKSRKENERILEPIKKAVIEITKTDKEFCPQEPMLKIRWSPRGKLTAREYIEQGYIEITIVSDYILKKYREIESDHEHKTEVTRKRIARNKRLKKEGKE